MADDVEEQRENNAGGITGKGFLPGQSGNPGGRPKGRSIIALVREILDREAEDGKSTAEMIAEMLVGLARLGDIKAIHELIDRTEGKAVPARPVDDTPDDDFEIDLAAPDTP